MKDGEWLPVHIVQNASSVINIGDTNQPINSPFIGVREPELSSIQKVRKRAAERSDQRGKRPALNRDILPPEQESRGEAPARAGGQEQPSEDIPSEKEYTQCYLNSKLQGKRSLHFVKI
ncbi:hypothetical protein CDL15_Pgr011387 [Punica granatum]|uniref:Uncharacterized protein n=1 Tax=Punica granatum TaxID=22663 RepID=A0A218WFX6_PUNGR|nr:hypothetical protein CDL15_Pgr011387 [Punica granatum]